MRPNYEHSQAALDSLYIAAELNRSGARAPDLQMEFGIPNEYQTRLSAKVAGVKLVEFRSEYQPG